MTAKDFREYAEEHLGWAKTARSTKERQTFLQMAQAWLEAADSWEAVCLKARETARPYIGVVRVSLFSRHGDRNLKSSRQSPAASLRSGRSNEACCIVRIGTAWRE